MKVKINKPKIKANAKDIDDLFTKILMVFAVLIILMFIVIPLITTMNIMRYLSSQDFVIAVVSLVFLHVFYTYFIGKKKPKRTRKPQVQFKPQQPFRPPQQLKFYECDMCKCPRLSDEIVEITNNVYVCRSCLHKALGEKHERHR